LTDSITQKKLEHMQEILRSLRRVAVAFSAGVDSTFVLKVALDTLGPENVVAVTGRSDSLAEGEFEESRRLAESMGAEHVVIETQEFSDPNYLANPVNRCYFCKTELYSKLDDFIRKRGLSAAVNGVNADDYKDWRPGLQAAKEHVVRAPCAEAGMTKDEIRALSAELGLPTFDKPASPCLSSRVQYGEHITPDKLKQIERSEALLKSLGFRECRVRHHNNLARIELPVQQIELACRPEIRAKIDASFREFGYAYVTIDLRGFRSGSLNEVIAFGQRQGG
jgi:pyridinium-3,5-biscarboxylic acid mononucleotide sulfurtransferase